MYNYIFKDNNNKEWARIDKRAARRLYNKGVNIVICADNMRPFGFWSPESMININNLDEYDRTRNNVFDYIVNMFEVYNCINRETGYRAAFYKEV